MDDLITEAAPTLMADTVDLAYSAEIPVEEEPSRWGRAVVIAVAILALAGGVAGALIWLKPDKAAQADEPTDSVDKAFISSIDPVEDWRYAVVQAKGLCPTPGTPAGDHAMSNAQAKAVQGSPSWTPGQAQRFTDAAIKAYCPQFVGPSSAELAAMNQDQRFAALLGSRLGLTTRDHSMSDAAVGTCKGLANGYPYDTIVTEVLDGNKHIKGWTRADATVWVDTAIQVYCP